MDPGCCLESVVSVCHRRCIRFTEYGLTGCRIKEVDMIDSEMQSGSSLSLLLWSRSEICTMAWRTDITEMMPGIMQQLGPEGAAELMKKASGGAVRGDVS